MDLNKYYKHELKIWDSKKDELNYITEGGCYFDPENQEISPYHKLLIESNLGVLKSLRKHLETIRKIIEKTKKQDKDHKTITFYNWRLRPNINRKTVPSDYYECKTKLFILTINKYHNVTVTVLIPELFNRYDGVTYVEPTIFETSIPRLNTLKNGHREVIGIKYDRVFFGKIYKNREMDEYYKFSELKRWSVETWTRGEQLKRFGDDLAININAQTSGGIMQVLFDHVGLRQNHIDEQKLFDLFNLPEKARKKLTISR